ncbi:MAG: DNA-3-methyladenine glycosylase 2 family protein [Microgenomates group bacterium]
MQNPKPDHARALKHFNKNDLKIYAILKKTNLEKWFQKRSKLQYFEALCRSIVGQQLSVKAAETIWNRFYALFPDRPLSPQQVLDVEVSILRGVGLSHSKSQYVKNIALAFQNQQVTVEFLSAADDSVIIERLTQIKGIGRWTAEMFFIFTLSRQYVFSMGDLALKKAFSQVFEIESPTPAQISKVTSRWEPFRTYASIALWESLG